MSLPILQIVRRPGIIDLGWGHPDPELLPSVALKRATAQALDYFGAQALQYGFPAGPGPLIEWLTGRINEREGRATSSDEIMITAGNSFALDQVLTHCTLPGDTVLIASPTYHLAVRILQDHPVSLVPVPTDQGGLRIDVLGTILSNLRAKGHRAKVLYTIPTYDNPTGVCLEDERRRQLVQLATVEELLIIEDDVYRDLAYNGPAPPSLWSIAPPGVVARLGSFSKSLAPGLRLGWLTAGRSLVSKLAHSGLLDSGGGINHFTALVVTIVCQSGDYDAQIKHLCSAYRERRDSLLHALESHLPEGCSWKAPAGGFFVWLELPSKTNTAILRSYAESQGVGFMPGNIFHLDDRGKNCLRLAFTLYGPAELEEAARRLGMALRNFR
jgi:2-aminoadipate transaminase